MPTEHEIPACILSLHNLNMSSSSHLRTPATSAYRHVSARDRVRRESALENAPRGAPSSSSSSSSSDGFPTIHIPNRRQPAQEASQEGAPHRRRSSHEDGNGDDASEDNNMRTWSSPSRKPNSSASTGTSLLSPSKASPSKGASGSYEGLMNPHKTGSGPLMPRHYDGDAWTTTSGSGPLQPRQWDANEGPAKWTPPEHVVPRRASTEALSTARGSPTRSFREEPASSSAVYSGAHGAPQAYGGGGEDKDIAVSPGTPSRLSQHRKKVSAEDAMFAVAPQAHGEDDTVSPRMPSRLSQHRRRTSGEDKARSIAPRATASHNTTRSFREEPQSSSVYPGCDGGETLSRARTYQAHRGTSPITSNAVYPGYSLFSPRAHAPQGRRWDEEPLSSSVYPGAANQAAASHTAHGQRRASEDGVIDASSFSSSSPSASARGRHLRQNPYEEPISGSLYPGAFEHSASLYPGAIDQNLVSGGWQGHDNDNDKRKHASPSAGSSLSSPVRSICSSSGVQKGGQSRRASTDGTSTSRGSSQSVHGYLGSSVGGGNRGAGYQLRKASHGVRDGSAFADRAWGSAPLSSDPASSDVMPPIIHISRDAGAPDYFFADSALPEKGGMLYLRTEDEEEECIPYGILLQSSSFGTDDDCTQYTEAPADGPVLRDADCSSRIRFCDEGFMKHVDEPLPASHFHSGSEDQLWAGQAVPITKHFKQHSNEHNGTSEGGSQGAPWPTLGIPRRMHAEKIVVVQRSSVSGSFDSSQECPSNVGDGGGGEVVEGGGRKHQGRHVQQQKQEQQQQQQDEVVNHEGCSSSSENVKSVVAKEKKGWRETGPTAAGCEADVEEQEDSPLQKRILKRLNSFVKSRQKSHMELPSKKGEGKRGGDKSLAQNEEVGTPKQKKVTKSSLDEGRKLTRLMSPPPLEVEGFQSVDSMPMDLQSPSEPSPVRKPERAQGTVGVVVHCDNNSPTTKCQRPPLKSAMKSSNSKSGPKLQKKVHFATKVKVRKVIHSGN